MRYDFLIVGAGYAGSVMAERLASAGYKCLVIDRRPHIAGNAYDENDENGVLIHRYGPHIFHTKALRIAEYLSNFTEWRPYEHRVEAQVEGKLYPIPINRTTVNKLYGLDLDEAGVAAFYEKVRTPRDPVRTSEDVVLNTVGEDLYKKFFQGYTRKQWGLDPSELASSVTARIPVRTNDDDRYFTDEWQKMPVDGYTAMFQKILGHENITVELGVDYHKVKDTIKADHTVYTGPIDTYFGYEFGKLPYRSLQFDLEYHNKPQYQRTGTVNYPNDHGYTRITEFKHLSGQEHQGTTIAKEYPRSEGDPYYPIPRPENEELYQKYKALANEQTGVTFVGRLAQYRYYNMDQVVGAALTAAEKLLARVQA